jgi:hypothetical protein
MCTPPIGQLWERARAPATALAAPVLLVCVLTLWVSVHVPSVCCPLLCRAARPLFRAAHSCSMCTPPIGQLWERARAPATVLAACVAAGRGARALLPIFRTINMRFATFSTQMVLGH